MHVHSVLGSWYSVLLLVLGSWYSVPNCLAQGLGASEIPTPISSRTLPVRFEHLGVADGLSQNTVYSILQDRHGYMWFGTQDGLNRFDGYEVKSYTKIPFDSTSAVGSNIVALAEDTAGYLWAGSFGEGVSRFDPQTGKFEHFRHDPDDPGSLGSNIAWYVFVGTKGTVWVTGLGGMCRHQGGDRFECFRHDPQDDTSIVSDTVGQVHEDYAGRLWVTTISGLVRMDDDRSGSFELIVPDQLRGKILERAEEPGVFWFGDEDGNLKRFDTESRGMESYPAFERQLNGLVQDPTNANILLVSAGRDGLGKFNLRSKRFTELVPEVPDPGSFEGIATEDLYADRSGTIWIGMGGTGVFRFNPSAVSLEHIRHEPDNPNSLSSASVRSIVQENNGLLWVTAGGVARIDRANGTFTHFKDERDPAYVHLADSRGNVWGFNTTYGLGTFDLTKGSFDYKYVHDPNDSTTISSNLMLAMHEDTDGILWLSTLGGLDRLDPITSAVERIEQVRLSVENNTSPLIIDIGEDRSGSLWLSIYNLGLMRFDPVTRSTTLYKHNPSDRSTLASEQPIRALERFREPGVIWVATGDAGLCRLDMETGMFKNFTVKDGLPNNVLNAMLEDEAGNLWMSTNRGLSRFNPDTETFRNYGLEAGLQDLEFNGQAAYKGPQGEMFFGGINGVNAFFPNQLIDDTRPPEIAIVDLKLSNQSVRETQAITLDRAIEETDEIRLGYDQRDLRIDYNAFHYNHPELAEFSYKLDGFNDDWVEAGKARSASYTNLAPGEYTFRVKAANSDGVWNEEGVTMKIIVQPPWWLTWWAYAVYGILVLGSVFAGARYQKHRLVTRERERARERELEDARKIEKAYNELTETQDRLVQSEKMASLGQLTAGIAHEIKNPLNFVNNFSEMSAEMLDDLEAQIKARPDTVPDAFAAELDEILQGLRVNANKIAEHGKRADGIVESMLEHSKVGEGQRTPVAINNLLEEYVTLALHGFKAQDPDFDIQVDRQYDESVGRVEVLPQEMGRVFMNLIRNAVDALKGSEVDGRTSEVSPRVTISTSGFDGQVEIRISDNGPGIPENVKSKIFEPFFTTKPTGSGTGLGLSMSYDIVKKGHGGTLAVESTDGQGATFIITLPA